MDKILLGLAALAIGVGVLFLPRTARASQGLPRVDVELLEPDYSETIPMGSSPLGLRNNNPFNLEYRNIGWVGEVGSDGRFSVFNTAQNGIRAGMINIHTKMTRDGLRTIRQIIPVLSPAFENPTESFIAFVARKMNVTPDAPLNFPVHIISLSKAIIEFENGTQPFTFNELEAALQSTGKV